MELKDRFLKYVSYDTQSSEESSSFHSHHKKLVVLSDLAAEMQQLAMVEVPIDKKRHIMCTIPA